ncbi:hypothetical protein [Sphingomonas bacterium]|uniref:hypothetical protein n=1 Tax=Sphingomonas bacterium TaxID=1895847 RepID=UPI00157548E9|nr:hypothetical protein [Sphingomonas bacterium]
MTTVATRVRAIADLEGFDLVVRKGKSVVDLKANGVLGSYGYEKKLKHSKTVADWKRDRFKAVYSGYTCDVLLGNGEIATGQTSLRTVRESYEDD